MTTTMNSTNNSNSKLHSTIIHNDIFLGNSSSGNMGRSNSVIGANNRTSTSSAFSPPKLPTTDVSKNQHPQQQNVANIRARNNNNNKGNAGNTKPLPGNVRIIQHQHVFALGSASSVTAVGSSKRPAAGVGEGDAPTTSNSGASIDDASHVWLTKLYTCLASNQIDEALPLTSPEKLLHHHRKLFQEESIHIVDRVCELLLHVHRHRQSSFRAPHQRVPSSSTPASSNMLPSGEIGVGLFSSEGRSIDGVGEYPPGSGGGNSVADAPSNSSLPQFADNAIDELDACLPEASSAAVSSSPIQSSSAAELPPLQYSGGQHFFQHDERSHCCVGRLVLSNLCDQMRSREVISTILSHMDRAAGEPQYDFALLPAVKAALHAVNRRKLLYMQPVISTLIRHMQSLAFRYAQDPAQRECDVELLVLPETLNFLEQTLMPEMQKTTTASTHAKISSVDGGENAVTTMPTPVIIISVDHTAAELLAFTCFQLLSEPLFYFEIPDETLSVATTPTAATSTNATTTASNQSSPAEHAEATNGSALSGGCSESGSCNGDFDCSGNIMAKCARRIIALLLRQTSYEFGDILNVTLELLEKKCVQVDIALQPQCETELVSSNQSLLHFISGYWHFWYLLLVRWRMDKERLPRTFSRLLLLLLKQLLIICRADFQRTLFKVSQVLAALFGMMMNRRQITCDEVDPTTEAVPLIICLVQMSSERARTDDTPQQAHGRITEFSDLFDSKAFYLIINRACLEEDLKQPEAVGFMTVRYKDRFITEWAPVHVATETQQQQAHAHAATNNNGSQMQQKTIDTGTNENSNEKAANIFANDLFELNAKHVWKLLIIVIECIEQAAKRLVVNCSAASSALGGAGDAGKAIPIPSGNNAKVWIAEAIAHIYSLVFALFERVCDAVGQQLSAIAPPSAEQPTALFNLQTWSETLSGSGDARTTDGAVSKQQDRLRETSLNDDAKQRSLEFVFYSNNPVDAERAFETTNGTQQVGDSKLTVMFAAAKSEQAQDILDIATGKMAPKKAPVEKKPDDAGDGAESEGSQKRKQQQNDSKTDDAGTASAQTTSSSSSQQQTPNKKQKVDANNTTAVAATTGASNKKQQQQQKGAQQTPKNKSQSKSDAVTTPANTNKKQQQQLKKIDTPAVGKQQKMPVKKTDSGVSSVEDMKERLLTGGIDPSMFEGGGDDDEEDHDDDDQANNSKAGGGNKAASAKNGGQQQSPKKNNAGKKNNTDDDDGEDDEGDNQQWAKSMLGRAVAGKLDAGDDDEDEDDDVSIASCEKAGLVNSRPAAAPDPLSSTLSSSRSRRLIPRWYRTHWQLACLITFVFSTFLIPCCHAADRDFYEILGVPKTATTNQIKKAYRKLAGKIHPDVNKGDLQAEQKFHDLAAAYETLSDDDKRQKYDQFGEEGLKQMGGGGSPFGGDPFSSFFGDFFNFGHQQRGEGGHHGQQTPRGADVEMDLDVTLEELYNSEFVEIVRNKPVARPAPGTRKCNCRQEMVTRQVSHNSFQMIQTQVCDECSNIKWDTEERILEVEIEQGMTDGQSQIFVGEGEPHVDGDAGDLRVIMRTLPHARFERRGDDLYTNVSISLQQALAGFEISLKHLDEHLVPIKREGITPPGARMRKKNEGMLNYEDNGRFGDLILTFDVKFPATNTANVFNEEQKQVLAQLLKQDSVEAIVYNGLRYNSPR